MYLYDVVRDTTGTQRFFYKLFIIMGDLKTDPSGIASKYFRRRRVSPDCDAGESSL